MCVCMKPKVFYLGFLLSPIQWGFSGGVGESEKWQKIQGQGIHFITIIGYCNTYIEKGSLLFSSQEIQCCYDFLMCLLVRFSTNKMNLDKNLYIHRFKENMNPIETIWKSYPHLYICLDKNQTLKAGWKLPVWNLMKKQCIFNLYHFLYYRTWHYIA